MSYAIALLSRNFLDAMSNRRFPECLVALSLVIWFSLSSPFRITNLSGQNLWTGNILPGGLSAPFAEGSGLIGRAPSPLC
jgi:hypothetical protein